MQLSNGRKAFYIIVSILIAFLVWFYLNNTASVELSANDIPVEFLNESSLANKGLVLISGGDAAVDMVFIMPRSQAYRFDSDRVRLIADLNAVNSTGTQTLSYSVASYPTGVDPSQVTVKSPAVRSVSVRVGELFRRDDVEIRCKRVGNVADGYVAGSVRLQPQYLEIWGQQSDVMRVSYAQVTLNIENARSTVAEMLEYELYDENDELIENSSIHAASDTIQVTMPVISATDVPLVVNFIEEPGVRIDSYDYSLDVTSVTLSGDANEIAALGAITLGDVVLSEIGDEVQQITYDIPISEGLSNLSGVTTATLTIANRDVTTRDFTVTSFDYENFGDEDRTVEVVTSSLRVTLRGARELLETITADQIQAVANLSGVADASGTYTVDAEIRVEGDPDVGVTEKAELTVRIGLPETEEETGDTQE